MAEQLQPPFAISFVVEGPPPEGLADAFRDALSSNPGLTGNLIGWLHTCQWEEHEDVHVREVAEPFGPGPVDTTPLTGLELVLYPNAAVFRCRHSQADGRTLQYLVQQTYRALRGETLFGSSCTVTDLDLAGAEGDTIGFPPEVAVAATGVHQGDPTPVWAKRFVRGKFHILMGRVMAGICRSAWSHQPGEPVCIHVPVDLRRPGQRVIGNLTGMVFVQGDEDPAVLQRVLRAQVPHAGDWVRGLKVTQYIPLWALTGVAKLGAMRSVARSRFGATAVLSNLGRVDLDDFGLADEPPKAVYFLGPTGPATAAFVSLVGTSQGVSIVAVVPKGLASDGRLDGLLDHIEQAMVR